MTKDSWNKPECIISTWPYEAVVDLGPVYQSGQAIMEDEIMVLSKM